jgi:hypothetical protein
VKKCGAIQSSPSARSPVHHALEHFNRYDAVELPLRGERVHVGGDHAKIPESAAAGFAFDIFALRVRIRHRRDVGMRELPRHPERQRTPAAAELQDRLAVGEIGMRDGLTQRFFLGLLQRGLRPLVET